MKKLVKKILPAMLSGIIMLSLFSSYTVFGTEDASAGAKEQTEESSFDTNEEAVSQDRTEELTESYGIDRKEVRNAQTDAIYEAYIKEESDPSYARADDSFRLANAIVVKQSLYDGNYVEDEEDIDSIMGGIEEGLDEECRKFITQLSDIAAVYDLSEGSDYYVAYINTMLADELSQVQDVAFAVNDNNGELVEGCIYDEETGLAYLPKELFLDEDGTEILLHLQVQLMQVMHDYDAEESMHSEVLVSTDNTKKIQSAETVSADVFDFETTVQTEAGLNEEQMTVSVNGIPTEDYTYDSENGTMTLYQTSATIQSISVSEQQTSAFAAAAARLLPTVKAYAMNVSQMQYQNNTPIYLPGWVNENIHLRGTTQYAYGNFAYDTNVSKTYGYRVNIDSDLQALQDVINGKSMLDITRVEPQWNASFITTRISFDQYTMAAAGSVAAAQGVSGWKLEGLEALGTLYMECSHVSVSDNVNGSAANPPAGSVTQQGAAMRFLKIDRAGGYAIVGIYTVQTHKQTGVSLFKMKIQSYGYGAIGKKDAVTGEVVSGAVYQVYTDASCTVAATDTSGKQVIFETTASYPYSNKAELTAGLYYVKETEAPRGYTLDSATLKLNVRTGELSWANKDGNQTGWNYDTPFSQIAICKVDSETGEAVTGATYRAYTDADCSTKAKNIDGNEVVLTTQADAPYSNVEKVLPGKYYIKEEQAPKNYQLDETVYMVTAGRDLDVYYINGDGDEAGYLFEEGSVYLKMKKISENPSLTADHPGYSLAGAQYGIYASCEDAAANKNCVATLTTNEEGMTEEVGVSVGTWYVKELSASEGYLLCSGADGSKDGIHVIKADEMGESYTIECKEVPAFDPFELLIQKMDYDTQKPAAQGRASLEGAIFALRYYMNEDGKTDGEAARTWYFKTDAEGKIVCNSEKDLLTEETLNDETVLKSSELYKDTDGSIVFPIGTYHISEISPPKYYQNSGYMKFAQSSEEQKDTKEGLKAVIRQDENGQKPQIYDGDQKISGAIQAENLNIQVFDRLQRGSITILKEKADGSKEPLEGVTFRLVGKSQSDEYTATTDQTGKVTFENLIPQNYVITEIKTADGYSLLKESIDVTIPMEMTLDELNENGADISKAVYDEAAGKWCFYNLSLTVGNSVRFEMPFTGSMSNFYVLIPVIVCAAAAGVFLLLKKRNVTAI